MFFLWRALEFHSASFQFLVRFLQVIAGIGHVHKRADAVFLLVAGEQHDARVCLWNAQLDPALFIVEWLIGDNGEAQFLGVKIEGAILVRHRDTDKLNLLNHAVKVGLSVRRSPDSTRGRTRKVLSGYRYSLTIGYASFPASRAS